MAYKFICPTRQDQAKAHEYALAQFRATDDMMAKYLINGIRYTRDGFLLKFGKPYFMDAKTYAGKREKQKECYSNAGRHALFDNMQYVEGVVFIHSIPIDHAWLTDGDNVIDPTIRPHPNINGYYGVPFAREYLRKKVMDSRSWSLLSYPNNKSLFMGEDDGTFL